MSLPGKSVHVRLDPDIHEMLAVLAEYSEADLATLAKRLLTKMVVAETHDLTIAARRMARLGLTGNDRDQKL